MYLSKNSVEKWAKSETVDKLDFIKIKNFCSTKGRVKTLKQQTGRKYLQKTHLIKDCYPKIGRTLKTQQ